MATKRQKNSGYQKKLERRKRWRNILAGVLGIGLQVFFLLNYFTHIPINKPIAPEDAVTVTVSVTDTEFGQFTRFGSRHRTRKHYHYLNIYTDAGTFRIEERRNQDKSTEPGAYNVLALNDVIQTGDTLTVTYRKYYPYLIPKKHVVGLRENDQIYRSLAAFNERVEGKLVSNSICTAAAVLLTLPVTLFLLDVPTVIWSKVTAKRREKYLAAKKAAEEAKTQQGPLG